MKKHKLEIAPAYIKPISKKYIDYIFVSSYNWTLFFSQYFVRPLGAMCIVCTKDAFWVGGGYPEDVVMNEDHDFVLKTSQTHKYGVIPHHIHFSVRRFEKESRLGLFLKYSKAGYLNLVYGKIKEFDYEFGHNDDDPNIPRVTLYCELYRFMGGIFYKGIGTGFITSYKNQKKVLEHQKIYFTENLFMKTNIFQANSHSPYTFYKAWRHRLKGKKIIFYAHSTAEDLEKQFRIFHLMVPLIRWYLSKLYNYSDMTICPSIYTQELLISKYKISKEKTIYISNGVDTNRFKYDVEKREKYRKDGGISSEEIVVTNVAMAVKRKGLETFINLGKIFGDVKFFWFGKVFNVMLAPKIPETSNNVSFTGYVPDILEAYLVADIFLFPSLEEQQGISILEAGAVGLPIIVRDIPAYTTWLTDGENCLKARTQEEFAQKLKMLIDDKNLREKLGKNLQQAILRDHSFEVVGNKLEGLYKKLL